MSDIPVPRPMVRRGSGPGVIFRHAGSRHPPATSSQATLSSGREQIEHPALRLEGISKEFSKIAPKRKADDLGRGFPQEIMAQPMTKRTKASVPPAFTKHASGSKHVSSDASHGLNGSASMTNGARENKRTKSLKKNRNRLRTAGSLNHALLKNIDQKVLPDPSAEAPEASSIHDGKSSRKSKQHSHQRKNGKSSTSSKIRTRRSGKAALDDEDFEYGEEISVTSNGIHRKTSKSDMSDHCDASSNNGISQRKKAQQARLTQEMQYSKQVTMFWSATEKMMQPVSESEVKMLQGLTRRCRQSWLALSEARKPRFLFRNSSFS